MQILIETKFDNVNNVGCAEVIGDLAPETFYKLIEDKLFSIHRKIFSIRGDRYQELLGQGLAPDVAESKMMEEMFEYINKNGLKILIAEDINK